MGGSKAGKGSEGKGAKGDDGGKGDARAKVRAAAEAARAAQKKDPPTPERSDRRGDGGKADGGKSRPKGREDFPKGGGWDSKFDSRWDRGWDSKGKSRGWDSKGDPDEKGKGKGKYDSGKGKYDSGKGKGYKGDPDEKGKGKGKGKYNGDADDGYSRGINVRDFEARIAKDMGAPKARKDKESGEGVTEEESERQAISKKISWLLRRGAASVGLHLNDAGWAKLSELIDCSTFSEITDRSHAKFMSVVHESNKDKIRYELKDSTEGLLIRAFTKEERKDIEERGDAAGSPDKAAGGMQAPPPPLQQMLSTPPQQQQFMMQTQQLTPQQQAQLQQMTPQQQFAAQQHMAAQQQMAQQMAFQQMAQQQAAAQQAAMQRQQQQPQGQQQQQQGQPPDARQMAQAFAAAGQALAQALRMPAVPGQPGMQQSGNVMAVPMNQSAPAAAAAASAPAAGAGASTFMSAQAPSFTPLEQQQNLYAQVQAANAAQMAAAVVQQTNKSVEDITQMWYSNPSADSGADSAFGFSAPVPSRALNIIDPKSGAQIVGTATKAPSALDYLEVKAPARKTMTIVDPSSGKAVDTFSAVNFKPAEGKKLEIIDPNSGASVKI